MVLSRVGFGSVESTSITLPGSPQGGDLMVMFAFRDGSATDPTIPAGWTSITNTTDGTLTSVSMGWRLWVTGDTSGTWTNASVLACAIYRGQATNKTPIGTFQPSAGTTNTVTYAAVSPMKAPGTSWLCAFIGHRNIDTTIETAPTNMTNQTNTVGASTEVAGHDTAGVYTAGQGAWPSTTVAISGTAAAWQTVVLEVLAEQGLPNNYQFATAGTGLWVTEKIR